VSLIVSSLADSVDPTLINLEVPNVPVSDSIAFRDVAVVSVITTVVPAAVYFLFCRLMRTFSPRPSAEVTGHIPQIPETDILIHETRSNLIAELPVHIDVDVQDYDSEDCSEVIMALQELATAVTMNSSSHGFVSTAGLFLFSNAHELIRFTNLVHNNFQIIQTQHINFAALGRIDIGTDIAEFICN